MTYVYNLNGSIVNLLLNKIYFEQDVQMCSARSEQRIECIVLKVVQLHDVVLLLLNDL